MLGHESRESDRFRGFMERRGLSLWFFDDGSLNRAFELMELYADHPMDLADASLVAAAESLGTRKVFTIDRKDFETYRVRRGLRVPEILIALFPEILITSLPESLAT